MYQKTAQKQKDNIDTYADLKQPEYENSTGKRLLKSHGNHHRYNFISYFIIFPSIYRSVLNTKSDLMNNSSNTEARSNLKHFINVLTNHKKSAQYFLDPANPLTIHMNKPIVSRQSVIFEQHSSFDASMSDHSKINSNQIGESSLYTLIMIIL